MRIGIDASRAVLAQRTGTENYSYYLIRALLAMASGHTFTLYVRQAPPPGLFPEHSHVEWRIIPFPRLWTHVRLAWEISRRPPDVLFVPAHVLPLIHPQATVATVHDLGYLHYPQTHRFVARRYLDWSTRHNARHALRVIADSEATRRDLIAHYGVPDERIVVAYPSGAEGMRPVHDPGLRAEARHRYAGGGNYLLYVGTLQPRKNLLALVRAFGDMVARGLAPDDLRLVLAGRPGWLYDEIVAAAQAPEMQGRVRLPGYVPMEQLPALLSAALAFCFPSRYEGFGLPILEAMACEVPVICSNASSLPEVAGDAALYFGPDDQEAMVGAMARVVNDETLRTTLIAKGRAQVARFSWERCAATVLQVLEEAGGLGERR